MNNHSQHQEDNLQEKRAAYLKFAAMILTSMVAMYILMYLNTYEASHVHWSETRFYMTLIMGAAMAVIMLSFMQGMYKDKRVNLGIYLGSVMVFAIALFLVRSQTTVQDVSYMRGMIPHHSIAILTSERAELSDVRVRELANQIILAQRQEIKQMAWLIDDISENGVASTQSEAEERPVPDFEASLSELPFEDHAYLERNLMLSVTHWVPIQFIQRNFSWL